jgi:hypothetical protein
MTLFYDLRQQLIEPCKPSVYPNEEAEIVFSIEDNIFIVFTMKDLMRVRAEIDRAIAERKEAIGGVL